MQDLKYLKPKEIAAVMRCTTRTVRNLCEKGKLKGIKWGADWRVLEADFLEYIGQSSPAADAGAQEAEAPVEAEAPARPDIYQLNMAEVEHIMRGGKL